MTDTALQALEQTKKKKKYRLRDNHKAIYAILWFLERNSQEIKPVPSKQLGKWIEDATMTCELHKKNYNRTCRTLVGHGMLSRTRDDTNGRPSFNLTEKSRAIAEQCFVDVFKMSLEEFMNRSTS